MNRCSARALFFLAFLVLFLIVAAACGSTPTDSSSDPALTSAPPTSEDLPDSSSPRPIGNPSAIGAASDENSRLPVLSTVTEDGEAITSREEYKNAGVSATGTTDDGVFGFENLAAEVRCRGNYTYDSVEKKSYRLKFAEKINLFGQGYGPARSWVLLANHCDQSFLRNHVAFTIGRLLSNIDYCSSSSFVRLYVNGSYQGIYQVAEQHQVQTYRVNIAEDPDIVDTDYLIERDSYADEDGERGLNYFLVNRTEYLVKSDYMTREKCSFLEEYFNDAHEAIKDGRKGLVERYIDLPSFIDTFILQALVKNTDIGYSSFFMVKKAGDKIYFTCPWDFDNALGNDERLDGGRPEGLYVGKKTDMYQQHEWFYLLMNCKWFCDMLLERWNEVKATLYAAADAEIDRIGSTFGDEIATNFDVWPIFGEQINQEPRAILRLKSYAEHVAYLKNWFKERYLYLDELFNSDALYDQGGFEDSGWWPWGW